MRTQNLRATDTVSPFPLLSQITTDRVSYKQQNLFLTVLKDESSRSEDSTLGWGPSPYSQITCILTGQKSKGCSVGSHSSVQSLSHVQLSATPWTAARQASLSITNSWSLLKLMSIELVMPSNHLILCRPLLLLPSIFPSIRVFSNGVIIRVLNPFTQAP